MRLDKNIFKVTQDNYNRAVVLTPTEKADCKIKEVLEIRETFMLKNKSMKSHPEFQFFIAKSSRFPFTESYLA